MACAGKRTPDDDLQQYILSDLHYGGLQKFTDEHRGLRIDLDLNGTLLGDHVLTPGYALRAEKVKGQRSNQHILDCLSFLVCHRIQSN